MIHPTLPCAKRASRCACLAMQTRGGAIVEPDLRHNFRLLGDSSYSSELTPRWEPERRSVSRRSCSGSSSVRKDSSPNNRHWSQGQLSAVFNRQHAIVWSHVDWHGMIDAFESNGSTPQRRSHAGRIDRLGHELEFTALRRTKDVSVRHEFARNGSRVSKGSCRVRFRREIGVCPDLRRWCTGARGQQCSAQSDSGDFHAHLDPPLAGSSDPALLCRPSLPRLKWGRGSAPISPVLEPVARAHEGLSRNRDEFGDVGDDLTDRPESLQFQPPGQSLTPRRGASVLDGPGDPFLAWPHNNNVQPRTAARNPRAAAKLGGRSHA